jgi:hypothetical protein
MTNSMDRQNKRYFVRVAPRRPSSGALQRSLLADTPGLGCPDASRVARHRPWKPTGTRAGAVQGASRCGETHDAARGLVGPPGGCGRKTLGKTSGQCEEKWIANGMAAAHRCCPLKTSFRYAHVVPEPAGDIVGLRELPGLYLQRSADLGERPQAHQAIGGIRHLAHGVDVHPDRRASSRRDMPRSSRISCSRQTSIFTLSIPRCIIQIRQHACVLAAQDKYSSAGVGCVLGRLRMDTTVRGGGSYVPPIFLAAVFCALAPSV